MPSVLNPGDARSLAGMIAQQCRRFPDRLAFVEGEAILTYGEWAEQSGQLAGALVRRCGVEPGARVAVMLPNVIAFPVCLAGVLGAGAIAVNVNPHYVASEMRHQIEDAGARLIFTTRLSLPALIEANPRCLDAIILVDGRAPRAAGSTVAVPIIEWATLLGAAPPADLAADRAPLARAATAFLQYTGGTTGRPKGAVLSHGNVLANVAQFCEWVAPLVAGRDLVVLTAIPLYHIFALTVNLFSVTALGGTNVLIRDPRDISGMCAQWARHRVNFVTGVNTLFNALTHAPGFADLEFVPGLAALGGGAPIQAAVSARWQALTGAHIKVGYGLSETSPVVSCTDTGDDRFLGSIGRPLHDTKIALRGDDGIDVAPGAIGEVCVAGPQIMQGYWNAPDATAQAMTVDGYFRTGDLGRVDEQGRYYIVGRMKEMILVSGFNVYPNEIEDVATRLAGIRECACIGMPHPTTGECSMLYVVRSDPALDARQIEAHCRAHLAAYKVPREIRFVDALPKSAVGKVLRRELQVLAGS